MTLNTKYRKNAANERFKVQNTANTVQISDFSFQMLQIPCEWTKLWPIVENHANEAV
jgi:hypothetical protein